MAINEDYNHYKPLFIKIIIIPRDKVRMMSLTLNVLYIYAKTKQKLYKFDLIKERFAK